MKNQLTRNRQLSAVAQICNLLYRRIVFCWRAKRLRHGEISSPPDGKSAIQQVENPCHYPHLRRGLLRITDERDVNPHPCEFRAAQKPRRGGLFIATEHPETI